MLSAFADSMPDRDGDLLEARLEGGDGMPGTLGTIAGWLTILSKLRGMGGILLSRRMALMFLSIKTDIRFNATEFPWDSMAELPFTGFCDLIRWRSFRARRSPELA
jgi:hypothetical protein